MAAFDEVGNGLCAAAEVQRLFFQYNTEASENLKIRIGIHAGEVVAEHNDLAPQSKWRFGCAAKPKQAIFLSPDRCSGYRATMVRISLHLASGG